jgi:hypothetical protein
MFKSPKVGHDDLSSRQAILWMHPTALMPFMTSQRWVITEHHLPEDVQFHHVFWDPTKQIFGIVCMSKEFKPVLIGKQPPELPQVSFRFYNPSKDGIIE